MTTTQKPSTTPPAAQSIPAPRTTAELVASAGSAHDFGTPRRTARGHGAEQRGLAHVPVSRLVEGRFGRMFRLPPFVPDDARIAEIAALMEEGAEAASSTHDNPGVPSGYTYVGQFVDHDLTFDPASSLDRQNDPDALTNFRTPRFDLDSLYGRGPSDDPYLYDKDTKDRLLVGSSNGGDDLPRNSQQTALIGDPRNDENTFVGQLHLTMIKFHNRVVDLVEGDPSLRRGSESTFETAQRIVRWHYQWMVLHDFLRRTVGDEQLEQVLDESGRLPKVRLQHYSVASSTAYMPVEFAVAAYRFGHSQIRGRYQLNTLVGPLPTFSPGPVAADPLGHFGGFRELPPFWTVEWRRFFEIPAAPGQEAVRVQMTRSIDTKLANPLKALPPEIGGDRPSLIDRNLTRGARLLLPSGQAVAQAMGVAPLSDADLELPGGGPAPLWYYVLREAKVLAGGHRLGPVGGGIVAEVFVGLMAKDPSSYLRLDPRWRPFLPSAASGSFTMADLIAFSGHGLDVVDLPAGPPPQG